jgi:chromodomain-helicase-DNA-binding protein 1
LALIPFSCSSFGEDTEFLIKWLGDSHLHNTWNTQKELKLVAGQLRLNNYIRKIKKDQEAVLGFAQDADAAEQYNIQREMQRLDYNQWKRVRMP